MATIHLYTLGYRGNDLINFNLKLHNPSRVSMMQEMEMLNNRLDAATKATQYVYSNRWAAKNILGLSDEEFVRNTREKFYDKQIETALAKIATEQGEGLAAETLTGTGFGGIGDVGLAATPDAAETPAGELGLETPEAPEAEAATPEAPAEPPAEAGGDEDVLLATPEGGGKRKGDKPAAVYTQYEDGSHTTKGSNGKKYWSVKHDQREKAGRKESWGVGKPRRARNVFKAMSIGTLVKENKSNYSEDFERRMSSLNEEMDKILSEEL